MEVSGSKTKSAKPACNAAIMIWLLLFFFPTALMANLQKDTAAIRVIMIGAHPDDCDLNGGGTAALFSSMGFAVKFVSLTNGDAGHQSEKGPRLAERRLAEAQEAGRRLHVSYDVLDHHD